ncbi:hypothetical protein DL95DRAFT_429663 [Leptodontidium sp. 2 PMI_412]|nr:hypothetical protein DL95DRAFT_429663 [Leptodontidium sp. 2 PMI_412]
MSGAEASLVLDLISSVIAIFDATKKVYDAAADSTGLPEAFREVAGRLPIVRTILGSVEQHISDGKVDEETCKAIKPVVIPPGDASRLDRYINAARTLGKGGRVESWMKGILEDVQLLASNHAMTAIEVESINKAIEEVSDIEPSIPDSVLQETASTNNNFGNGPMTNNNVSGNQFNMTNNSTGEQYQAETQNISISKSR